MSTEPDIITRFISTIVTMVGCAKYLSNELPAQHDNIEGVSSETTTSLQDLKTDLRDLIKELRESVIDDVRVAIKEELRVEMFLELQRMNANALPPKNDKFMMDFNERPFENSTPDALQSNPLFARVNKSLERMQSDNPALTIDDFINSRGDRFDNETLAEILEARRAVEEHQILCMTKYDKEEDQWDTTLKGKHCDNWQDLHL